MHGNGVKGCGMWTLELAKEMDLSMCFVIVVIVVIIALQTLYTNISAVYCKSGLQAWRGKRRQ